MPASAVRRSASLTTLALGATLPLFVLAFISLGVPGVPVSALPASHGEAPMSWSVAQTPSITPPNRESTAYLTGVSCPARDLCLATGNTWDFDVKASSYYQQPFIEHYDGRVWTLQHPSIPGAKPGKDRIPENQLNGIACATATWCVAVGEFSAISLATGLSAGPAGAVVEVYGRGHWSTVRAPAGVADPDAVSCPAPESCLVLGMSTKGNSVSYSYRSGRWSAAPFLSVIPGPDDDLRSLDCITMTACMAVGYASVGTAASSRMFAERFDGSYWEPASYITWSSGPTSSLSDISCEAPNNCLAVGAIAVGSWEGSRTPFDSVVESFSEASWRAVLTTSTTGAAAVTFGAVDCVGADCIVLGIGEDALVDDTEQGGKWTSASLALPRLTGSYLDSLACAQSSLCVAVGGTANEPLVLLGSRGG